MHELPFKLRLPFDIHNNNFTFMFVTTMSVASTLGFCTVGTCLDLFPVIFMSYAVILLDDLCEHFETLVVPGKNKNPKVESREKILELVEEHLKIKQLIKEMTNIIEHILLMQGLCSSMILCAISYSLSTVSNANLE